MAIVAIRVNGREYNLACDDGQEEHLRFLADEVDERARSLAARMGGQTGEAMGLLLVALTMADELIESKRENPQNMAYDDGAVAQSLNELAERIENIADSLEIR